MSDLIGPMWEHFLAKPLGDRIIVATILALGWALLALGVGMWVGPRLRHLRHTQTRPPEGKP